MANLNAAKIREREHPFFKTQAKEGSRSFGFLLAARETVFRFICNTNRMYAQLSRMAFDGRLYDIA